jgi:hypothetical protein
MINFKNLKNMKKIILTMALLMAFSFANAQSNDKGKIHVNVMFGIINGNASITNDNSVIDPFNPVDPMPKENNYSAAGVNFGANFQYGFAKNISAGAGIEIGTVELTDGDNTSITSFKVNFSGRYYFLNHEKINLFAGPSIGYTSGTDSEISTTYTGLNYGINTGCNYYFGEKVGMIFNLGYEVNSLGNVSIDGVKAMLGLALKFR